MARNKVKSNTTVFAKLQARSAPRPIANVSRWISTEARDRDWLLHAKIGNDFILDSSKRLVEIVFLGSRYFLFVGLGVPPLPDGLTEVSVNAALLTALLAENELFVDTLDPLEVYDKIFFPLPPDYKGHDAGLIRGLCVPLSLVAVQPSGPFDSPHAIGRLALLSAAQINALRTLQLSPKALSACIELALEESYVPVGLMTHSLISVKWEHCFLDLYRCVERLFAIPTILSLKQALDISHSGMTIARELETLTGWKKFEEDGLVSLMEECTALAAIFHGDFSVLDSTCPVEFTEKSTAKHIYKLRNSIVHYRAVTELPTLTTEAWQRLSEFLIDVVRVLYTKYSDELAI